VTINRPERLNACDGETYRLLTEVWQEFRDDPVLRVGILTGVGDRAFCVGTDIKADDFHRLAKEPVMFLIC
jgi:enoyl-CoA hydratase/E-phenylitaconyl-CoA hydratase